ncbi:MAG: MFS transporter [Labedaea sp.]
MTATETAARHSPWDGDRRAATAGLLMIITIMAFESLGLSTVMPRMVADLHGDALYSWPFTAALAASVTATVLSGRFCDRFGPTVPLLAGLGLFLAGLLVAGTATGMPALLAGRALQGFGGGTEIVAVYVLVALVYPEALRARVFGLVAAAWVVPSLVGPTAAGLITVRFGWRWVFLGLVPFVLLGLALLVGVVRGQRARPPGAGSAVPRAVSRRGTAPAALATGFGVTTLTWAVQHPSPATLALGAAGLAALVPALRVLLPRGTLRARPGLPVTVLARGLFAGAMFGVEAYVPLTLVAVHHQSPALAGLPLTVGALGWAAGSHWQGRRPDIPRPTLIRASYLVLAGALAAMTAVAPSWGPAWLALPLWVVAGSAMGVAYPAVSVLTLEYAAPADRGFASAALQVSDMVCSALAVGLGGVLLTTLASASAPTAALVPLDLLMAGVALLGALVFRPARDGTTVPGGD